MPWCCFPRLRCRRAGQPSQPPATSRKTITGLLPNRIALLKQEDTQASSTSLSSSGSEPDRPKQDELISAQATTPPVVKSTSRSRWCSVMRVLQIGAYVSQALFLIVEGAIFRGQNILSGVESMLDPAAEGQSVSIDQFSEATWLLGSALVGIELICMAGTNLANIQRSLSNTGKAAGEVQGSKGYKAMLLLSLGVGFGYPALTGVGAGSKLFHLSQGYLPKALCAAIGITLGVSAKLITRGSKSIEGSRFFWDLLRWTSKTRKGVNARALVASALSATSTLISNAPALAIVMLGSKEHYSPTMQATMLALAAVSLTTGKIIPEMTKAMADSGLRLDFAGKPLTFKSMQYKADHEQFESKLMREGHVRAALPLTIALEKDPESGRVTSFALNDIQWSALFILLTDEQMKGAARKQICHGVLVNIVKAVPVSFLVSAVIEGGCIPGAGLACLLGLGAFLVALPDMARKAVVSAVAPKKGGSHAASAMALSFLSVAPRGWSTFFAAVLVSQALGLELAPLAISFIAGLALIPLTDGGTRSGNMGPLAKVCHTMCVPVRKVCASSKHVQLKLSQAGLDKPLLEAGQPEKELLPP